MSKEEGARFEGAQCVMEPVGEREGGQQSEVRGWGVQTGVQGGRLQRGTQTKGPVSEVGHASEECGEGWEMQPLQNLISVL